jgi:peptidoglycan/LPS O-acetylase OafA/YrhL
MRADSPNLDVLRSVAVMFVVLSHLLLENTLPGGGNYHVQTLGTLGVLIFFVHTCLVLMLSLDRQTASGNERPSTFLFLVRRAFRIYPLSIVAVIVVASIAWMHSDTPPTGWAIISNLLLVQNLTGHTSIPRALWSLPFEFQMYFFLPALYMLVSYSGKFAPSYIGALWLAAIVFVLAFRFLGWDYELIRFFPCFLPGVLAFSLRRSARDFSPMVLFLFVGAMAILDPWMVGQGAKATILSWPICLVLGLIIPRCREIELGWLQTAGRIIARYSYGIYLVHGPMIDFAFHYFKDASPAVPWAVFIVGTAGLSYFAYHAIEKPCIEFGRVLVDRVASYRIAQKRNV